MSKCAFSIRNKYVCLCPVFMTVNLELPLSILPQIMSHHPISEQIYVHAEGWWKNWPSSMPFSLMSHCASLLLEITCEIWRGSLYHNPAYPHLIHALQNNEQTLLWVLLSMFSTPLADTPGMASDNLIFCQNKLLTEPYTALFWCLALLYVKGTAQEADITNCQRFNFSFFFFTHTLWINSLIPFKCQIKTLHWCLKMLTKLLHV